MPQHKPLLRVFGCVAHRLLHPHERKKLNAKSGECIFIGYYDVGYRLWSVEDRKIKLSRNVVFDEDKKGATLLLQKRPRNNDCAHLNFDVPDGPISDISSNLPTSGIQGDMTVSYSGSEESSSAPLLRSEAEQSIPGSSDGGREQRCHCPPT